MIDMNILLKFSCFKLYFIKNMQKRNVYFRTALWHILPYFCFTKILKLSINNSTFNRLSCISENSRKANAFKYYRKALLKFYARISKSCTSYLIFYNIKILL